MAVFSENYVTHARTHYVVRHLLLFLRTLRTLIMGLKG